MSDELDLAPIETWLSEHRHFHSARKGDVLALLAEVKRLRATTPDWEYGVGYEGDDGIEKRWYSINGGAFVVREAAESVVRKYGDPQLVLMRRRSAGPWLPVPAPQTGEVDG